MAELSFDIALSRDGVIYAFDGAIPLEGVTAVMGHSGSGKTTLLMMLAGLERRARGDIRFGENVWAQGRRGLAPEARRVGFVFQEGRLFGHLSVAGNIAYGARRRSVSTSAMQGIVDGLGLAELMDRRPVTLSGGETRRVAVARAMASGPEVLFMDEPLSGLDDDAKAQVLPYIARALGGSGIPAIYVTHSHAEVVKLADRVLHVSDGRLSGWGVPPANLAATVIEAGPGRVTVELGEARITLPGHGQAGDARRIALSRDAVLVSRDAPGASGAAAVLPAEVLEVRPRPSGPDLVLRVAGQRLGWHIDAGAALASRLPVPGERLWLSILSAALR